MSQLLYFLTIDPDGKVEEFQQALILNGASVPYLDISKSDDGIRCSVYDSEHGHASDYEGLHDIVQRIKSGPALQALHLMLQRDPITDGFIKGMGGELADPELCRIVWMETAA